MSFPRRGEVISVSKTENSSVKTLQKEEISLVTLTPEDDPLVYKDALWGGRRVEKTPLCPLSSHRRGRRVEMNPLVSPLITQERKKGGDEPPYIPSSPEEEEGWRWTPLYPLFTGRGRRVEKNPPYPSHQERKRGGTRNPLTVLRSALLPPDPLLLLPPSFPSISLLLIHLLVPSTSLFEHYGPNVRPNGVWTLYVQTSPFDVA
jgi:hypothetical protein